MGKRNEQSKDSIGINPVLSYSSCKNRVFNVEKKYSAWLQRSIHFLKYILYILNVKMPRSREGLCAAGEWHQLKPLFPALQGKKVLYSYASIPQTRYSI